MLSKLPVAVLGATGPVGQKVISLLENHPRFYVAEVAASEGRVGKRYGDVVAWKNEYPLSRTVGALTLRPLLEVESPYVISALPTEVAREVEPALSQRGCIVSSNAAAFRMERDVPLLIPEVNPLHLTLLDQQSGPGRLLTNPNCSTVFLTSALRPLLDLGAIEHVSVVTMQALSGAGYPGVASFDLLGNVIPHIGGEEAKIEEETKRILGSVDAPAPFSLTVHVHRVPVVHGHTIAAHVRFRQPVPVERARAAYLDWQERVPSLIRFHEEIDRPQPARDLSPHEMAVHVGRLKQGGDPHVIGLISLGHNLVRGAAGAAIANLAAALDYGRHQ